MSRFEEVSQAIEANYVTYIHFGSHGNVLSSSDAALSKSLLLIQVATVTCCQWSIEARRNAVLWSDGRLQRITTMTKVHKICVDLCAYGGARRDPTVIWTSMDTLHPLSRRCLGKCPHCKHAPLVSQSRRTRANYGARAPQEFRRLCPHLVLSLSHVPQTHPQPFARGTSRVDRVFRMLCGLPSISTSDVVVGISQDKSGRTLSNSEIVHHGSSVWSSFGATYWRHHSF